MTMQENRRSLKHCFLSCIAVSGAVLIIAACSVPEAIVRPMKDMKEAVVRPFASEPALAPQPAPARDEKLELVLQGKQRTAVTRARDSDRHPLETLQFFGLHDDLTVVEIMPGSGWYSEILAPYLRDHGHFYAAHYALNDQSEDASQQAYRRKNRRAFDEKLKAAPEFYGKAQVGTMPDPGFTDIDPPGGADMVLTFRNLHNWLAAGNLDSNLKAFFDVLKPGGVLGVEEHRAVPGTSVEKMIKTGYMTEAYVIEHAKSAGFELVARSEINANPRDTKDHPQGVWALPPTLRDATDADRPRLLAIGESDRMTLKFVKPLKPASAK
jgi:predicted methyltransferase